jgi:hypothetical protein
MTQLLLAATHRPASHRTLSHRFASLRFAARRSTTQLDAIHFWRTLTDEETDW